MTQMSHPRIDGHHLLEMKGLKSDAARVLPTVVLEQASGRHPSSESPPSRHTAVFNDISLWLRRWADSVH